MKYCSSILPPKIGKAKTENMVDNTPKQYPTEHYNLTKMGLISSCIMNSKSHRGKILSRMTIMYFRQLYT